MFYLKHDKIIEKPIEESQVKSIKKGVEDTVKSILKEGFKATPNYQVCKNCEYWNICDEKESEG